MKKKYSLHELNAITRKSYDAITSLRHAKISPDYYEQEFLKFREYLPQGRVIDIGCGTGRDAHYFLEGNYNYLGIDYSEGAIEVAKENNPNAQFRVMDFHHFGFPDEYFDGVWAAAALLHVPKDYLPEVLNEMHRVLKQGGIGFVTVKQGVGEELLQGKEKNDRRYFVYFQKDEMVGYFQKAHFEILQAFVREHSGVMNPRNTRWLTYFIRKA